MAIFKDAYSNFKRFYDGFEPECAGIIQKQKPALVDMVKAQLYSGLNGRDKQLRPTYETDPYFKTPESGHWRNNGKGWAKWKYAQTPPRQSSYGHPPRSFSTPNLIIKGNFYDSITAVNTDKGVNILSQGVSFGSDIERKYGSIIFGIGSISKRFFINHIFRPNLKQYINKFR
jgi:hypothetical protein